MTDLLDAKVALVTGAARGLGATIVETLSAQGATVIGADRRVEDGRAIAARSGSSFVELDVTDADSWAATVAGIIERHERIDVLVNNAGIIRVRSILDTEPAEFRKVVDTNLVGTFLGIKAVAPMMIANGGGSIVNLSSPGGFEGTPGMGAYTSSKWGIRGLTRTAALEFGGQGIRVNAVVPGPMRTAMTRRPGWEDADYDQHYESTVALRRMGELGEVAELVAFLASDRSSYCTGGDFTADGGVTAGSPPVS